MKKFLVAALAGTAMFAAPAQAADNDGKLQVKLLGTLVAPDGKITDINTDIVGLPATTQTEASDNFVPTLAIEYFAAPNFSMDRAFLPFWLPPIRLSTFWISGSKTIWGAKAQQRALT